MPKLIHVVLQSCEECIYGDQSADAITCLASDPPREILSGEEFYQRHLSVQQKYGTVFPAFCPLPDVEQSPNCEMLPPT